MNDARTNPSTTRRVGSTRFDLIVAVLTAVTTSLAFVVAILTPPKSGPFCTAGRVEYPYTEIAAYILLIGLHERTSVDRTPFTRVALAFGAMAATILTAVYFVQLRFVQPAVLKGELDGLTPWTQYNPHGMFIALEEAGYMLMGAAFLFAALALSTENRLMRAVRIVFLVGFVSVTTAFVALSVLSGFDVEYRFEVAAITIDWTVLIVAGALLAIAYRTRSEAALA